MVANMLKNCHIFGKPATLLPYFLCVHKVDKRFSVLLAVIAVSSGVSKIVCVERPVFSVFNAIFC